MGESVTSLVSVALPVAGWFGFVLALYASGLAAAYVSVDASALAEAAPAAETVGR